MNTCQTNNETWPQPYGAWNSYGNGGGFVSYAHLVTPKEVWAGPSPEHAFSEDIPWTYKRQSKMKYFEMLEEERRTLCRVVRFEPGKNHKWTVEPQISAFFMQFPWPARASVGHTVFLEAAKYKKNILSRLRTFLCDTQRAREYRLNEAAYEKAAHMTAESLGNRALFDMLGSEPDLGAVEFYRFFQAAAQKLHFRSLSEIIDGVVLLGDVLPDPDCLNLHPMTRQIMTALLEVSRGYWQETMAEVNDTTSDMYLHWGGALMQRLVHFLPPVDPPKATPRPKLPGADTDSGALGEEPEYRYPPANQETPPPPEKLPPLNQPQPPELDSRRSLLKDAFQKMLENRVSNEAGAEAGKSENPEVAQTKKALNELLNAAADATSQRSKWEDMREDLVEEHLAQNPFASGPVEGQETAGMCINMNIGGDEVGGALFDRNVALSENREDIESLRLMAAPVSRALRSNLYPNTGVAFVMEYPRASGQMDSRRLPLAEISDAVYRRFQAQRVLDPVGRAVLLIAADASASLSDAQMRMCKCLMTAWLESVPSTLMQVLAAFYHSGSIRANVSGPLVQWVYHPRKTPVHAPRDAVAAVANLSDSGSGAQSDALSLRYLLDEAAALSKGACVYLTLISDCAFNKSFHEKEIRAVDEVVEVIRQARDQAEGKLHITLVSLNEVVSEEIRHAVDAVIPVSKAALDSPEEVAATIDVYVASCIRNRKQQVNTSSEGIQS